MHSYLVTLLDRLTGAEHRIVVQSDCPHGMQQFVDGLALDGKLPLDNPVVIDIESVPLPARQHP